MSSDVFMCMPAEMQISGSTGNGFRQPAPMTTLVMSIDADFARIWREFYPGSLGGVHEDCECDNCGTLLHLPILREHTSHVCGGSFRVVR
jgi:hypothetical protein